MNKKMQRGCLWLILCGCFWLMVGCSTTHSRVAKRSAVQPLKTEGYTVQVGVFSRQDFAARMENKLLKQHLDAYYFRDYSAMYRVRFGNYRSRIDAEKAAQQLRQKGIISEFRIIAPSSYPTSLFVEGGDARREQIVNTARSYLGVPYQWGGTSAAEGVDCSGLTLLAYRSTGVELPRISREQYAAGRPVEAPRRGDLVFFTSPRSGEVSHVGVYLGNGEFIHAPSKGKNVRIDNMNKGTYATRYVGARSYL
ncbi:MAG: C40 family peptidase [Deltaproteobacteria bacterium]|nr:C40 family peptidase [Deltaproteobacteria bacterium]